MAEPLPKFDAPPVIETAMGVQFDPLQGFSTAMAGWFWKSYLQPLSADTKWERAIDVPRIDESFEKFGDSERWGRLGIRMLPGATPNRIQIIQAGNERMVQVQDSRFILNWTKKDGGYPSFTKLSHEFWGLLPAFEHFVNDAGVGPVAQNQWEIIYVNKILKDQLWQTTAEWPNVIPQLSLPVSSVADAKPDPMSLEWRFVLPNERGRLYINMSHVRDAASADSEDFMQLTLTSRGPIDSEKGWDLKSGFELGHESIVRTFAGMTSSEAHKIWKRKV